MDISKEYILMCKKAVEIQELHIIKPADFVIWLREDGILTIGGCEGDVSLEGHYRLPDNFKNEYIWLPRQDQLQEMTKYPGQIRIQSDIQPAYKTYWELNWTDTVFGTTLEQTWLKFIMKSNYNKTWNGKEWIDE